VEIIEARLEEIFEHVTRELKKINRDGKLPAGMCSPAGEANFRGWLNGKKTVKITCAARHPPEP